MIIASAAVILVLFYLMSIMPNTKRSDELAPFENVLIAHRGLHGEGVPENSLLAFGRAVTAGYGIELDVQITADGRVVVFHDKTLERVCGDKRKMNALTYAELQKLRLMGTDERIPLLSEVLEMIGGKVPIIIEIKPRGSSRGLMPSLDKVLKGYNGIYCVQSFNIAPLIWYRKNRPEILRGQLSTKYHRDKLGVPFPASFILTNLMMNFATDPDFISYNFRHENQFSFRLCRKLYRSRNAAWTIRSQSELDSLSDDFSIIIFDSFIPKK